MGKHGANMYNIHMGHGPLANASPVGRRGDNCPVQIFADLWRMGFGQDLHKNNLKQQFPRQLSPFLTDSCPNTSIAEYASRIILMTQGPLAWITMRYVSLLFPPFIPLYFSIFNIPPWENIFAQQKCFPSFLHMQKNIGCVIYSNFDVYYYVSTDRGGVCVYLPCSQTLSLSPYYASSKATFQIFSELIKNEELHQWNIALRDTIRDCFAISIYIPTDSDLCKHHENPYKAHSYL